MIEFATDLLYVGLALVLLATWRGLPLLGIVLLLDMLGKRRIAARCQLWLWMLVVVRLMFPISLESPVSLSGPVDGLAGRLWRACQPTPSPQPAQDLEIFSFDDGTQTVQPRWPAHLAQAEGVVFVPPPAEAAMRPARSSLTVWLERSQFYVAWTWGVVALLFIARSATAQLRFVRRMRLAPVAQDEQLLAEVARVCRQLRIGRLPRVVHLDCIAAPAVFGWWRPVLCFPARPAVELSPQELTWVLRHELAHVRGRDALLLGLSSLMRAVHWFNPLAWLVEAKLREAMERSADALATREMSSTALADYGRLLLRYATAESSIVPTTLVGLLPMASARGLRGRLRALGRHDTRSWTARFAMIVLLASVAGTGLTDAAPARPQAGARPDLSQPALPYRPAPKPVRKLVSLDANGALGKAARLQPGIDAERFVCDYFASRENSPTISNGMLTAKLSDFEERTVQQRLRAFERTGPWQISVECRLIDADSKLAEAFSWNPADIKLLVHDSNMSLEGMLAGRLDRWDELLRDESAAHALDTLRSSGHTRPILAAKLSEPQIRDFVRRCQSDERCRILHAPRVTVFNGQTFSLASMVERPFVTNVTIADEAPLGPLKPTINVIPDGWSARLSVEATEDGAVDLACILHETEITDVELAQLPIRSTGDPQSAVIVQVPDIQRISAGSQTRLQPGETLAIAIPRTFRDRSPGVRPPAMFYLFTPRLIADSENLSSYVPK